MARKITKPLPKYGTPKPLAKNKYDEDSLEYLAEIFGGFTFARGANAKENQNAKAMYESGWNKPENLHTVKDAKEHLDKGGYVGVIPCNGCCLLVDQDGKTDHDGIRKIIEDELGKPKAKCPSFTENRHHYFYDCPNVEKLKRDLKLGKDGEEIIEFKYSSITLQDPKGLARQLRENKDSKFGVVKAAKALRFAGKYPHPTRRGNQPKPAKGLSDHPLLDNQSILEKIDDLEERLGTDKSGRKSIIYQISKDCGYNQNEPLFLRFKKMILAANTPGMNEDEKLDAFNGYIKGQSNRRERDRKVEEKGGEKGGNKGGNKIVETPSGEKPFIDYARLMKRAHKKQGVEVCLDVTLGDPTMTGELMVKGNLGKGLGKSDWRQAVTDKSFMGADRRLVEKHSNMRWTQERHLSTLWLTAGRERKLLIKDYLDGLKKPDNFDLLRTWLEKLWNIKGNAETIEFVCVYCMTYMAARVLEPDELLKTRLALVLHGSTNIGKTSSFEDLFPFKGLYNPGYAFRPNDPERNIQAYKSRLLVEVGEGQGFDADKPDSIKEFLSFSTRLDDGGTRLSYDKSTLPLQRTALTLITTNTDFIPNNDALVRRLMYLEVSAKKNPKRLEKAVNFFKRNRDDLFAQAVWRFKENGMPELTPEVKADLHRMGKKHVKHNTLAGRIMDHYSMVTAGQHDEVVVYDHNDNKTVVYDGVGKGKGDAKSANKDDFGFITPGELAVHTSIVVPGSGVSKRDLDNNKNGIRDRLVNAMESLGFQLQNRRGRRGYADNHFRCVEKQHWMDIAGIRNPTVHKRKT